MHPAKTDYQALLTSSYFMDYHHPKIEKLVAQIASTANQADGDPSARLIKTAFEYVRDTIVYRVTHEISDRKFLKASSTLQRGYGHCVAKAVLLGAITRALGVPTRLHFVDLQNHQLPETWKVNFGEKLLWHGFVEVLLANRWVALNPAYDKALCDRQGYFTVEFDGEHDALFSKLDKAGRQFMDYVNDHGVFARVPYFRMGLQWMGYYGPYFIKHRLHRTARDREAREI